jgi:ComEC/Rec2-related protein
LHALTHLTAVSGANLTLLLAFLLTVARWLGVRGWLLRGGGLVGVLVFVALCRTEPSVLRAAAMGLVALAALGSGSRSAGLRNLAVAMMILLLVDPFLGRSIGFALSVLACAGIVWWARRPAVDGAVFNDPAARTLIVRLSELAGRLFVCHNRNVVFPEPLTPIRPSRMPGPMDQERSLSSVRPPNDTLTGIHAGSAFQSLRVHQRRM